MKYGVESIESKLLNKTLWIRKSFVFQEISVLTFIVLITKPTERIDL